MHGIYGVWQFGNTERCVRLVNKLNDNELIDNSNVQGQVVFMYKENKEIEHYFIGQELLCHQGIGNTSDPYTIGVYKPNS